MVSMEIDNVNHPLHYTGSIECIDAMIQQYGVDTVLSFCLCNAFKYLFRCNKKHKTPIEDIKKAQWYINKYIELYEQNNKDRNSNMRSL